MASNNKDKKLGWHFLPVDMRLTNGDGRLVEVGKALSMQGRGSPSCCSGGMHASEKPSQAASFKRGPVLTRVEVWGDIDTDSDKFSGRHRRVLWARRIIMKDVAALAAAMRTNTPFTSDVSSSLSELAYRNSDAFDCAVLAWAKKNGLDDGQKSPKAVLTAKHVTALLLPRVIRTEREIRRDIGKFYDLTPDDDAYSDRLAEVLEESLDKIVRIDDFDGLGTVGYVLAGRRR